MNKPQTRGWRRAKLCGCDAPKLSDTHSFLCASHGSRTAPAGLRPSDHQEAHTSQQDTSGRMRHPTEPDASPPGDDSDDRDVAPNFSSARTDLKVCATAARAEAGRDTPSSACDSGQGSEAPPSLRDTQTPKDRGLRQPACDSGRDGQTRPSLRETQTPKDRGLRQLACDSGRDGQTRPSLRETQTPNGRGLRQLASATQTESPAEESAPETTKSPEQTQNVVENNETAAQKSAHASEKPVPTTSPEQRL